MPIIAIILVVCFIGRLIVYFWKREPKGENGKKVWFIYRLKQYFLNQNLEDKII